MNNILVVVLTCNRPEILKRCIDILTKNHEITTDEYCIVIDDSDESLTSQNSIILEKFCNKGFKIFHIVKSTRKLIDKILYKNDKESPLIFSKPSKRDISGLRNLGLFFSFLLGFKMTCFMDDDIIACSKQFGNNQNCFFDMLPSKYRIEDNFVVGASLGGIIDESYIGRIEYLVKQGKSSLLTQEIDWQNYDGSQLKKNSLWVADPIPSEKRINTDHASAGCFAFCLNFNSVLPFPSGYNEDWNWCLLQSALCGTKFYIEQVPVIHAPPSIVPYEENLLLWESLGELIFDSLQEAISSKDNFSDLSDIHNLASKKITHKNKIKNQLKIIQTLNSFKKDTVDFGEQKIINTYVSQIANTLNDLKLVNLTEYVDTWFKDLIKRKLIFSRIIANKEICNQVHKVLSCAETKPVKLHD